MRNLAILALALCAAPALAQDFPLTIDHKFGQTVIEAAPQRVASIDYNGADNLLALGVQPVMVRYWFGDYPRAVWPWAEALLTGTPEILKAELNFEQIAATDPDLIMAVYSGITAEDYAKLSEIAPVVTIPEGVGDYELGWQDQAHRRPATIEVERPGGGGRLEGERRVGAGRPRQRQRTGGPIAADFGAQGIRTHRDPGVGEVDV